MAQYHALRLTKGDDLKKSLLEYVKDHQLAACIVSCCVGSLSEFHVRVAGGQSQLRACEPLEILSLTGTLCTTGCHLHISVST